MHVIFLFHYRCDSYSLALHLHQRELLQTAEVKLETITNFGCTRA